MKMNYLSVYNNLRSTSTTIKLLFDLNGRQYTLARPSADLVGKTLKRIALSVLKVKASTSSQPDKKNKATSCHKDEAQEVSVELFHPNGDTVSEEASNSVAWSEGNILQIGNERFLVEENTPVVVKSSLPSVLMAGFPVVPTIKMDFSDKLNSQYKWFKQSSLETLNENLCDSDLNTNEDDVWILIGQEFTYVPKIDDMGYHLKFLCKAASSTKEAHKWHSVVTSTPVSAGPGPTPFEARQLYTSKPISDPLGMRVMSYNVLADCYLEDKATRQAWFGYCPDYALEMDYRQQLLLKEILGYNCDIISLQECGRRLFQNVLTPVLESHGYTGVALYKSGVMAEGAAIFVRQSKFSLVLQHDIVIKDAFLSHHVNRDMLTSVNEYPQVLEKMLSRTTVAQVLILNSTVSSPQNYICVVNTHLYFRPNAAYIRNLQVMTILNHVDQTLKELLASISGIDKCNVGVVFCGDLNSTPESSVTKLLCGDPLQSDNKDWILQDNNGKPLDIQLKMPVLRNPFDFHNCCGFPEFTNYTEGFKGAIDYIFATKDQFEVQAVLPMPTADDLQVYTAIPSPVLSSDHLALVCELKLKH